MRARINGRDGILVAGGSSEAVPALASVEFFDLKASKWLSLGRMRQGRRFPGVMVVANNLIIMGTLQISKITLTGDIVGSNF